MLAVIDYSDRGDRLRAILDRSSTFDPEVDESVRQILAEVRERGDEALAEYTGRFDHVRPETLRVTDSALERAWTGLDAALRSVIAEAAGNIRRFHENERRHSWITDDEDGTIIGQRVVPIERAGLYVPGGTAAYPSSVLMAAIPAQVAGVEEICLVSPPSDNGCPHRLVLAASHFLGLKNIYAVGGAQAIGALAFGTETIPRVDKIVGPGNAYVAAAKKQVFGRVGIDSIAGPSEIVVLADDTADAGFVAADLLSQAEHDARASAVLVTPHRPLAEAVAREVKDQVAALTRGELAAEALERYGAAVVTETLDEAVSLVNELAPEHLEILTEDPMAVMPRIRHAGAVFLGSSSPEPVGDYFAGPNHILPTGGTARYASALGVEDFLRRQSIISYSRERLLRDGPKIVRFAQAESLDAHARSVQIRLDRM